MSHYAEVKYLPFAAPSSNIETFLHELMKSCILSQYH
jgi:hypothetical protein